MLSDWFENLVTVSCPFRSNPKPLVAPLHTFPCTLYWLHIFTSSFDWFNGLRMTFVIGQSDYFGFTTFNGPFLSCPLPLFQNESTCENVFHLQVHFHANQSHFYLNGFARRLVLKLRQKATREWPIENRSST